VSRHTSRALAIALLLGAAVAFEAAGPRGTAPAASARRKAAPTARRTELRLAPVSRYDFEARSPSDRRLLPEELSGISWMGGDRYAAVGDRHACVHFLTVRLDPATGRIARVRFGRPLLLTDERGRPIPDLTEGRDREGIRYDPRAAAVWISNERTGRDVRRSSIARHLLKNGRRTRLITVESDPALRVFATQRSNLGFESLTGSADGRATWTANEGPLRADGRKPTASEGGVVRLVRFDAAMRVVAELAYEVDPFDRRIETPALLRRRELSGLSDLALLPDGRLLALERAFAGDSTGAAGFRIRIYDVDPKGATDVSRPPFAEGLAGQTYTPVRKRLLWEGRFGPDNSNFEGITLGPRLRNGDRAVILVADNEGGPAEALYALRLSGLAR
jgi:hypothetical protein